MARFGNRRAVLEGFARMHYAVVIYKLNVAIKQHHIEAVVGMLRIKIK